MVPPEQKTQVFRALRPVADPCGRRALRLLGEQIADLCERAEPMLDDSDTKLRTLEASLSARVLSKALATG